jgi:hypothetical protein
MTSLRKFHIYIYIFIFIFKNKGKKLSKFKEFKAFAKKQIGKKIKALRNDNGGEFKFKKFQFF